MEIAWGLPSAKTFLIFKTSQPLEPVGFETTWAMKKHPACLGYKKGIILLVPSFMGVIISNHYARISIKQTSILGCGFKYVLFSPLFGEDSHFDEHIFQMGLFNHQLDIY